ncbi:MAG: RHS repeat-associated core domain-containing protein [Candidatus Electrothrix scaldis]|nr:MAG: RHS repeat-associated core domain-containing protein [Candidatus Electrothrix sp. GW3-3]
MAAAYGYDASGNIATDSTNTTVYDLTDDQRLASVTKDGVTVGAYQYDGRGLRTVKTVNGETSLFIYCKSGKLIAEADSDGNILKEYVYLDGDIFAHFQYEVPAAPLEAASSVASSQEVIPEPVAEQQATSSPVVAAASVPSDTAFLQSIYLLLLLNHKSAEGAYYYINDHLGTPQIITDDSGAVVWQAEYLPFGNVNISVAQIENNLRFPGQYYDVETGLHYNWNRYYSPETGRYIAADPIGLDGGMNLYAYVGGNPINSVDVFGLKIIDGFDVTKDYCGCQEKLKKQLWSEQKMQLEYLRAGLSPKNKREEDIYASMEASLSKQGHGLEVQGSYDANSDNITVEKVSGQCGPLLEHCTKIHEEKHKQNKKDLEKKWGVQTMDFWGSDPS